MDALINTVLGRVTGINPDNVVWCLFASAGKPDEFGKVVNTVPVTIEERGDIPNAVKVELMLAFLVDVMRDKDGFYAPELAENLDTVREMISMELFKQKND